MRILYLHQHFSTRAGCGGTRSYEFARLLQAKGHEVTIVCGRGEQAGLSTEQGTFISSGNVDGVKVVTVNVSYSQKMGYARRLVAFATFVLLASWVAIRRRQVDLIYATSTPLTIVLPAVFASWVRRCPFVFEVRDLWPAVPVGLGILRSRVAVMAARWIEQLGYSRADHIVALSPGMKVGILRSGAPEEKVSVIPNACDNGLFDVPKERGQNFARKYPFIAGRPLVVYAGAFGLANGLDYLIRLAARVRSADKSIGFLLVGDGKEKPFLQSLAQNLGVLNETLWFLDPVPRLEMPEVLAAATVAMSNFAPNPVLWDNSANKVFDALAAGRPVVLNYGGWQAELLEASGAGIVLPAADIEKAAEELLRFLSSKERLEAAQSAARRLAIEEFDRNKLVEQLERILLNVLGQTPTVRTA